MMGEKPQVALECTGRQSSVRTAIFPRRCFLALFILRKKEHSVSTTADPLDFPSHSACLSGKSTLQSVKFAARCSWIGCGQNEQMFPHTYMFENQIDVQFHYLEGGLMSQLSTFFFLIICLVPIKRTDTENLLDFGMRINIQKQSNWFPLEEAVEAFHTSANPESGSIKVQIVDL
ncbi:hypothetical protein PSHT_16373 [Puccinia striiformis]|uniref:Alcohol dehydrogenase-like C-terminal domain-containing protein n=1 Tax=Puccinia striiformis TaxID=27350 RepID=A0A2S4UAJ0_9BASI|nr:hypothetical protein PSHT_16373 [Puccinia striiformis]